MNGSNNYHITTSLREFINSGYLSNTSLRLVGDYAKYNNVASTGNETAPPDQSKSSFSKLHSLNCTKLSLLLAKVYAAKLDEYSRNDQKNDDTIELDSLQFDNFFLKIYLEDTAAAGKNNATNLNGNSSGKINSPPTLAEGVGYEEKKIGANVDDDDIIDPELLLSVAFDAPNQGGEAKVDIPQDSGAQHASTKALAGNDVIFDPSVSPLNKDIPGSTTWTILDINIICHNSSNISSNQFTPIQLLGNHIHAIYSQGNEQHLSSPIGRTGCESGGGDFSGDPPSSKQRMVSHELFSTLIERGYPVSVCRLLSDMIDLGGTGNADNPYTTLDDFIQDLEQMASCPELYLYDQDNNFYSSNILFGQRCYGRVNELEKILEISTRLEQSHAQSSSIDRAEAVFVSGAAGSGKSHFVMNVGSFLEKLGWMVLKVKFRRDMEHGSREIISSLFEKLVCNLISMRDGGNVLDADYSRRAVRAISNALDQSSLSSLAEFLPSLQQLITEVTRTNSTRQSEAETSRWKLVILLSRFMRAMISLDRHVMICLDDLQWCDPTAMDLIKEIIVSVGQDEQGRHNFLCVGMYREEAITESHPLSKQLAYFQISSHVAVTETKLSSLSIDEVAEMIASEMRLPRRLVRRLADVVHKKTSGYALFVVQLLNSLVRDSIISYSPKKVRFDWDESKLATLKTMDSVASLIVSNLSFLLADELQSLRVLSCFGVQIPLSLVKLFDGCLTCVPERGIEPFLPGLASKGVVEVIGPSVFFSHDLIQQHVYESIPVEERRQLHLGIGTYIAKKIGLDSVLQTESVESRVEELNLGWQHGGKTEETPSYPLVAIATNQINYASPQSVSDHSQQIRFAGWNLYAGKSAAERSNFQAALYHYKSGISFMGDNLWVDETHQLCHDLHEGAAVALFGLGDLSLAAQQATLVIDHVQFEDSLAMQYILLRSFDGLGQYHRGVSVGLELLRKLQFDIPSDPSPSSVMNAMRETGDVLSAHSFNQLTSRHQFVGIKKRNVFKIVESLIPCFFRSTSPYLPLVACAIVKYSLENGVCEESATGFFLFGYFKVALEGKWDEGHYWGKVCLKILEGASSQVSNLRTDGMVTTYLMIFYRPLTESAFHLFSLYQQFTTMGAVESALYSLSFSLQMSFFGSEQLSLILDPLEGLITSMMNHSEDGAKIALLQKMLICDLTGKSVGPFPRFGEGVIICDERSLLADTKVKRIFHVVEQVYLKRFFSAFWMGDYPVAISCSQQILALPNSKMPKIQGVFHSFFMGLIHFQTYRDGEGESYMDEGKKAMEKMHTWVKHSPATYENKLHLIKAEYHASSANIQAARAAYEASVRSARDHGLVHEQALACELYAKFLASIIEHDNSRYWFNCAHILYHQWGAAAKCKKLRNDHLGDHIDHQLVNKHGRGW